MKKMEGEKQNTRYGISQNDLLEVVEGYTGMPWLAEDKFDVEAYKKARDEILGAERIVQRYEGSGMLIGGCLFEVPLESRVYDIGTRIVKLKSPTFNAESGDSVIDMITAHPLARFSEAQRKQILAWCGDEFKQIAEKNGLRYFNECCLMTENLHEVPYENMRKKLSESFSAIMTATEDIQETAQAYARKQFDIFN